MWSLRAIFIFIIIQIAGLDLFAQKTFQPKQVEFDWKGIIYRNEKAFELTMHTSGWQLGYNTGRLKSYDKTHYYHISLSTVKDSRESRQNRNIAVEGRASSPFVFGKINSMLLLRGGIGRKKYLSEKARRKGIAIGYTYQMGPAIGIMRPYYLDLLYPVEDFGNQEWEIRKERYSEENQDVFLNYDRVFGGAGFSKGWSELSFVPGIQARGGLLFSLGAYDKYVKMVEVGVMADLFIKKLNIMTETASASNKPYLLNFYLSVQFGYRNN